MSEIKHNSVLGMFEALVTKDRYENPISLITLRPQTPMEPERAFNVVHTSKDYHTVERFKILGTNRKFVRCEFRPCKRDNQLSRVEMAGFSMAWGDGDPGWIVIPDWVNDRALVEERLTQIYDDDPCAFMIVVLHCIVGKDEHWETKVD